MIKKAAIFGAGTMGAGIAQVMAAGSIEVLLLDVKAEFVEKGIERIAAKLKSNVEKGKLAPEEKSRILERIKGSIETQDVKDVDLVIEAVIEDRNVKGDLFKTLNKICQPETIFATNTSTLSVTDLATLSGRPDKFIGVHFFNPVPVMKLVEVIPGLDTSQEVAKMVTSVMTTIRKIPVVVQDCAGFLVNRVLLAYINEAVLALEEGISPEVIDGEARKAGFPMGPLELTDMVGWDVSHHTFPILHDAYGDRFPSLKLVQKLNEANRLGLKTGKGVYTKGQVDDEFKKIAESVFSPGHESSFDIDRLILKLVNEAVYCLQESVATADDIDRAMVLGTGFPNEKGVGGPLRWADEKGLDWVLASLEKMAAREGSRFWPHHLLKTYVAAGRLGQKTQKGFFEY